MNHKGTRKHEANGRALYCWRSSLLLAGSRALAVMTFLIRYNCLLDRFTLLWSRCRGTGRAGRAIGRWSTAAEGRRSGYASGLKDLRPGWQLSRSRRRRRYFAGGAALTGLTAIPGRRSFKPEVITRSSAFRPAVTTRRPSSNCPACTSRPAANVLLIDRDHNNVKPSVNSI